MEKMIFDQSPSALDHVPLSRSNKSMNSYSSFSSSSSSSYSPYSSGNSLSHLQYNYNNVSAMPKLNNNAWPLCQNPLVPMSPSLYSSLPLPQPKQPPLLPLPLHKTSSFPTQLNQKKFNGPSAPKRKPRAATKREPRRTESKNVKIPLERKISLPPADDMIITNDENNTDEEILIASQVKEGNILDCYSVSPPPSSLPLPGLALLRPKMKRTTACITEAVLEEAKLNNPVVVDNGSATDNLRRILRL